MSINTITKSALHGLFTGLLLHSTAVLAQDFDGTWSVAETVNATACGEGTYVDNYSATVKQTGSSMSVTAGNITRSGAFSGNRLTFSVSYPEEGGTNSGTGTISFSGNTASGNSSWTWSNASTSCSGTSIISATRSSTPTPTPTPTPEPEPTPVALGAPVLSFLTSNTMLDVSWTSVPEAQSYTLFYAPYPAADPILTLDLGLALNASGQLALSNAFYIAIQANFAGGKTTLSNIENFTITGVDSVDVTDPASDISSIIYGSNGSSLITWNVSTSTQAVMNFKDGKQGIVTGDGNGKLTQLSIDGFSAAISYGNGSKQISITAPDGTVSTVTTSALAQTAQTSQCTHGSTCSAEAGVLSALEDSQVGRFERILDDTIDTFRRISTVPFCSQPAGILVCKAVESYAERGSSLKERLINRVSNNISRIGNALTCAVASEKCGEIAAKQAPALVQQLEGIGTISTRPSAGFDIGAEKVTPKDSWKDYLGDGSFTMTDVPCAESVFASIRPECSVATTPDQPDGSAGLPTNGGGGTTEETIDRCVTASAAADGESGCYNKEGWRTGEWKTYLTLLGERFLYKTHVYSNNATTVFVTTYQNIPIHYKFTEVTLVKNKAEGEFITYFQDGSLRGITTYVANIENGPHKSWWEPGALSAEGQYVDGKQEGHWVYYYRPSNLASPGTKSEEGTYLNGNRVGVWTSY